MLKKKWVLFICLFVAGGYVSYVTFCSTKSKSQIVSEQTSASAISETSCYSMAKGEVVNYKKDGNDTTVSLKDIETLLDKDLDQANEGIALKETLEQSNRDYQKEVHIPELVTFIPRLKDFFYKAAEKEPDKKKNLDLIFKQLDDIFAKKQMSMINWVLFNLQATLLFSDPQKSPHAKLVSNEQYEFSSDKQLHKSGFNKWGKLDIKKLANQKKDMIENGLPVFIYTEDGIFGLKALVHAFLEKVMPLPVTTNHTFEAHNAGLLSPISFLEHDKRHYDVFAKYSPLSSMLNINILQRVLGLIQKEKDPYAQAQDYTVLFLLIHEMFPFGEDIDTLSEIIDGSRESARWMLDESKEISSRAIKRKIRREISFYTPKKNKYLVKDFTIKHIGPGVYEASGSIAPEGEPKYGIKQYKKIKKSYDKKIEEALKTKHVTRITVFKESKKVIKLVYKDVEGKEVVLYRKLLDEVGITEDTKNLLEAAGIQMSKIKKDQNTKLIVYNLLEQFREKYVPFIDADVEKFPLFFPDDSSTQEKHD